MRRTYALVSLLIGIPCVWQPHIQACDLSSHLYNAWLVNQVSAGQLSGLYIVPQFTNVLFDHLLSFLMEHGGPLIAERLAVLLVVQIFFWGCFRLASVMAGHSAWSATPFLAMAAYGAVFRMGFFNFYLAVGICAWAIALVWRNHPRLRLLAIPLLALAYTANSVACVWAIAVIAYAWTAQRFPPSTRPWFAAICLLIILGSALFLAKNIASRWVPGLRMGSLLGSDQVVTYGMKYTVVAAALLCLWILLLVRRFESSPKLIQDVPLQLLALNAAACLSMPDSIWLPIYSASLAFIVTRLSLLSAILFCAVIAPVRMHVVEKCTTALLLVLFFWFSFVDERALNSVEVKMNRAIATLPFGARVVATVRNPAVFVPALRHLVDRGCIGRCFDFANYEPATTQFRLRALPGNSYVMTEITDVLELEHDKYLWDRRDIELYRLSPCQNTKAFCVTVALPGEQLLNQKLEAVPLWWKAR